MKWRTRMKKGLEPDFAPNRVLEAQATNINPTKLQLQDCFPHITYKNANLFISPSKIHYITISNIGEITSIFY